MTEISCITGFYSIKSHRTHVSISLAFYYSSLVVDVSYFYTTKDVSLSRWLNKTRLYTLHITNITNCVEYTGWLSVINHG